MKQVTITTDITVPDCFDEEEIYEEFLKELAQVVKTKDLTCYEFIVDGEYL